MIKKDRLAAILFATLFVWFTACSQKEKNPPGAQASPSPQSNLKMTASQVAAMQGLGWNRSEEVDQMDGQKIVGFSIFSTNKVLLESEEATVLFTVTCGGDPEMFIVKSARVENPNIRIKFDDAPPISQKWHPMLGALTGNASPLFKQLVEAKAFKIEFTPMGRGPQVAVFNVANLKDLVTHEKTCKL